MTTLAIDTGTQTGFAILRVDGCIESGTEDFAPRANDGRGTRWVKFRRWLVDVKQANPELSRIVFEKIERHGPNQVASAHVYGGFVALIELFGEHHSIPVDGIGTSKVKKHFAGSGNAQKHDVIAQCRALGFNPGSHNEADAIALLHVAMDRCPLLTPTIKRKPKTTKAPAPEQVKAMQPRTLPSDGNPF